ncbi:MAG: hypothetical protein RLY78_2812 [Pseudomonadota bacterium]
MPPSSAPGRARWLRTLHQWHWISSAVCLIGMLLFALTGITLNHAADIPARADVQLRQARLPDDLRRTLSRAATQDEGDDSRPLPPALRDWLTTQLQLSAEALSAQEADWSPQEIQLSLPRPGGDAWLRISLDDGAVVHERTDRGWIALFNDLHKGRHAGPVWRGFIDVFGAACLVFSVSGLLILQHHAGHRAGTWPLVGLGLVLPLLLVILFIH